MPSMILNFFTVAGFAAATLEPGAISDTAFYNRAQAVK